MERLNLAARAGRWSADNWNRAFFGWLVFSVVALVIGMGAGHKQIADSETASGEAAQAQRILEQAGFKEPATESVLVQSKDATIGDPKLRAVVSSVVQTVSRESEVTNIQNPLTMKGGGAPSPPTRHSALVQFDVKGDMDKAKNKIQPVMDAVAGVQKANPGVRVEEFGMASAMHVLDQTVNKDFKKAEKLTLPITLLILLVAFGALVAAGLPVLLAFSAVLASIGLYSLFTNLVPGDFTTTQSVILLIGMAVGVDYSLFYLRREREERHAGQTPREALLRTAATSGQAVLVSGATVLVAMAGMFLAGNKIFTSIAIGTMLVVLASVVGSVTVLAALLSKLGDRVDKGRIPLVGRRKHDASSSRAWGFVLDRVLRRPVVAVVVSAAALVAASVPVLGMHTRLPSFTDLPHSLSIVSTYERMQKAFPGSQTPAGMVVKGNNVTTPQYQRAYTQFKQRARATRPPPRRDPAGREDAPERPRRGDRPDGGHEGLQRPDEVADAVRVRLCARARVPALADDVPLDRDPDQVDPAQSAFGRLGVRDPRARLPAPLGGGHPRLQLQRRDHVLAAAVSVRCPLRAVDGLPRLHPQPGQGAGRPRDENRARRLVRDPADGGHGDERRDRHGRRVRDLRATAHDRHEADGRRARRRRSDRRDDHPRGVAAGGDEAAWRLELVLAALAGVAAVALGRGRTRQGNPRSTGRAGRELRSASMTALG